MLHLLSTHTAWKVDEAADAGVYALAAATTSPVFT